MACFDLASDQCLLAGVIQTSHFKGVRTVFSPGCVKLEKSRDNKNNFPKSIAAHELFDDQKRHLVECLFYAVAAPLRFYTTKTHIGHWPYRQQPCWGLEVLVYAHSRQRSFSAHAALCGFRVS